MTFWALLLISTFSSLKTNKTAMFVQGEKLCFFLSYCFYCLGFLFGCNVAL